MNVEIGTETPIFLFWEYLFRNFGILSLQCRHASIPSYLSYYGRCDSLACRFLTLSFLSTAGIACLPQLTEEGGGRIQIWRQEKNCRPLPIYNPFLRVFTSHLSTPLYISLFIIRLKRDFSGNRTDLNPDAVFSLFTQKTNETKNKNVFFFFLFQGATGYVIVLHSQSSDNTEKSNNANFPLKKRHHAVFSSSLMS